MKLLIPTLTNGRQQPISHAFRKPSSQSLFLAALHVVARHKRGAKLLGFFAAIMATLQIYAASYPVTLTGFGTFNPVGIHLNNPAGNDLNTLFPGATDNDNIFFWDCATQDYDATVPTYIQTLGQWVPNLTLTPGQGIFYVNQGTTRTATLTGNPVAPTIPPPQYCGCDKKAMLANQTATTASWGSLMGAPPVNGSQFIRFDVPTQDWYTNKFENCAWTLGNPVAAIGEAVWVVVPCTNSTPCLPCTNNLVINGSFENPVVAGPTHDQFVSMPGWTATHLGSPTTLEVWKGNAFTMTPQDGNQHLEINSATNNVVISQVITNVSTNCPAKLCFWYAGRVGHTPNNFQLQILGSGLAPVDFNPPPYTGPSSWQQHCVEFTPLSTTLTIRFTGTSGAALAGAHIDNVSLMQCCTNPPCTNTLAVVCSTNKTVQCGSAWQFDPPTASSLCCPVPPDVFEMFSWTNGNCPKVANRVWQIVDCFTNITTCTQTVTIVDTVAPVVKCPGTNILTYTCEVSNKVYYQATASDACSGSLPVTFSLPPGSYFGVGATLVTATATDACGNVGSCSFYVTVSNYVKMATRTLGKCDSGVYPMENAVRSGYLNSTYGSGNWSKFDEKVQGKRFGASFLNLRKNLSCATLEICMKPYKKNLSSLASLNDTITISAKNSILLNTTISSLGASYSPWRNQTSFQCYIKVFTPAELALINAQGQLDVFIQDSTIVDCMKLTYCYCEDLDAFTGVDTTFTNATLHHGPFAKSFKPINPVADHSATFNTDAARGLTLVLPVKQIGFVSNATLTASASFNDKSQSPAIKLTGNGDGSFGLGLSSVPSEVTQVQARLKLNGVVVAQGTLSPTNTNPNAISWMHDGVEVFSGEPGALAANEEQGNSVWCCMEDGVDSIVWMEDMWEFSGVIASTKFRNPGPVSLLSAPPVNADELELVFVDPTHTENNVLTSVTFGASGLSQVDIVGAALHAGELPVVARGDVNVTADADHVTVSANATGSGKPFTLVTPIRVPTNSAIWEIIWSPAASASNANAEITVFEDANAKCSIIYTQGQDGVRISTDFTPVGSSNTTVAVYQHGTLVASGTLSGTVNLPILPEPFRVQVSPNATRIVMAWDASLPVTLNGSTHMGNEVRFTAVNPTALAAKLTVANIGSSGQDGVRISTSQPPARWTMKPLEILGDELSVEWSGPMGGALESAPIVTGPWNIVPGQNAQSATLPAPHLTNAAPAQFFRMRSN